MTVTKMLILENVYLEAVLTTKYKPSSLQEPCRYAINKEFVDSCNYSTHWLSFEDEVPEKLGII